MENWLSIMVGIYLISMALYGHYRGFIRLAVSMVAFIATLVIVHAAMPQVNTYLKENTGIHQSLERGMKKTAGLGDDSEQTELPSQQRAVIEGMNLPKNLKTALLENNNREVYNLLGVEAFGDYVGSYLADMVLNIIGFILIFAAVYLILHLVMKWLDLLARLPILSGMNKIAGALLGAAEGIVFIWIVFLVITACSGTSWGRELVRAVEASPGLSFLYDNNLLNVFLVGMIKGVF